MIYGSSDLLLHQRRQTAHHSGAKAGVNGNTPLRLSTCRLPQVRLVYYAFYNFAFYHFAWNVIVRHLVYLTSVFHNVSNLCTVILDFIPGVLVT